MSTGNWMYKVGKGLIIVGVTAFVICLCPVLGPVGIIVVDGVEILCMGQAIGLIAAGGSVAALGQNEQEEQTASA
jgi:hypothetical protein